MGRGFEPHRAHPAHKARTLASRIVGSGSGLVGVLSPVEGVDVELGVEQRLEGPVVLDAEFVVFVDVDLGEEGLVAQASVGVVEVGGDDLDALVVVLNQLLGVDDQDRPACAFGAFGVSAGADEVGLPHG